MPRQVPRFEQASLVPLTNVTFVHSRWGRDSARYLYKRTVPTMFVNYASRGNKALPESEECCWYNLDRTQSLSVQSVRL